MKKQLSIVLISTLAAMFIAFPAAAEDDPLTKEQILSHPEVAGAIAAIDAYVQGVQRRSDDLTIVGHSGGCPGYITQFIMVPKHKIAVIALTNAGDGPAWQISGNIMDTISGALEESATPFAEDIPDFSLYEGNYESRPWGGEVAIRQWATELVAIDIPGDDLTDAIIHLEHDGDNTFTRLTDAGDCREPWVFEVDDEGKTTRIYRHSGYLKRID